MGMYSRRKAHRLKEKKIKLRMKVVILDQTGTGVNNLNTRFVGIVGLGEIIYLSFQKPM